MTMVWLYTELLRILSYSGRLDPVQTPSVQQARPPNPGGGPAVCRSTDSRYDPLGWGGPEVTLRKIGFDREKYLALQSEQINARRETFGGKLYLEFGGKLFDDMHAARVLPGFTPDNKMVMLEQLADEVEIIVVVSARRSGPTQGARRPGDPTTTDVLR